MTGSASVPDPALAAVVREEAGAVVAALTRRLGDFDLAEEAVQDALVEALRSWPVRGVPERPGAWLQVAARRNAIDRLRRRERQDRALAALAEQPPTSTVDPDEERLALVFACCHPALPAAARMPLTLRAVIGLTTAQVARAFLVPEATMAQRIVRAKRKIVTKGIALSVPEGRARSERLDDVLTVTYLMYNEAFVSTTGRTDDRDLADDAVWLGGLLAAALPDEPEVLGLLALLHLQHARQPARFDVHGRLVLLPEQDRTRWDRDRIAAAERLLDRAAARRRPGRFQLQAAIAACHADAPTWETTDWWQIVVLYDALLGHHDSAVTRLNRAVALAQVRGAGAALPAVEALAGELDGYHLFHATRADLLRTLGRHAEAVEADRRALALTANRAEQSLLRSRLEPEA